MASLAHAPIPEWTGPRSAGRLRGVTASPTTRLELTREQILTHRRSVGGLNDRLPFGDESLRRAAWAGLQDSMPRAALLSIHARVAGTASSAWEDPSLVQLWGPRFSAYVVVADDLAVFSLGRLPDDAGRRQRAEDVATRLEDFLDGRRMSYGEAGHGLGVNPNFLRYAAPTGRVLIRWEGAGRPTVWTVPSPAMDPGEARLELARRHLQIFGPTTPEAFGEWAGIRPTPARAAFAALAGSISPVRTPMGKAWILSSDEPAFRAPGEGVAPARLLPSGDAYWLLQGADRELLVPDAGHRSELWTPRVWPGALLVAGEVAGTWRRAGATITIWAWRRFSPGERHAVEEEAGSLPLPGVGGPVRVSWG
ncbi:MAG TPA: crosslink repair DNA glycosylase YcaQ family protein [Candidatus Limnocylindrales bacterium]